MHYPNIFKFDSNYNSRELQTKEAYLQHHLEFITYSHPSQQALPLSCSQMAPGHVYHSLNNCSSPFISAGVVLSPNPPSSCLIPLLIPMCLVAPPKRNQVRRAFLLIPFLIYDITIVELILLHGIPHNGYKSLVSCGARACLITSITKMGRC